MPQVHDKSVSVFDDSGALMHAAAEKVVNTAAAAVAARGRFMWALSGGSTPRRLYSLLANPPYVGRIDWDRVHFFWGDERCVAAQHPDSNYRMARESLIDVVHPPAANVHRMQGELAPEAGASAYEATLRRVFFDTNARAGMEAQNTSLPRFDLVLLGMGNDGHTASLFPGEPTLAEKERWVVATHVKQAIPDRTTLTFPVLNAAAHVLFLVAGADKAARLGEIFGAKSGAPYPAALVRPVSGELHWMLDAPAAAAIDE